MVSTRTAADPVLSLHSSDLHLEGTDRTERSSGFLGAACLLLPSVAHRHHWSGGILNHLLDGFAKLLHDIVSRPKSVLVFILPFTFFSFPVCKHSHDFVIFRGQPARFQALQQCPFGLILLRRVVFLVNIACSKRFASCPTVCTRNGRHGTRAVS